MRVLVADKLPDPAITTLLTAGLDVRFEPALKAEGLAAAVAEFLPEVLVVRSTKVSAAVFEVGCLGLVVRAGAGVNTIDLAAASQSGIYVANCPGKNSLAVAELAIGLLVSLDRRIPDAVAELRAGRWCKGEFSKARGLAGRRLGVLGGGGIGRAVAARASAMDMDVVVWERASALRPAVEDTGATFWTGTLAELLPTCDAVTIHLPATAETRGLAGPEFFAALPDGALFINTSRAEIVDEAALLAALDTRGMRAALDVFSGEGSGKAGPVHAEVLNHPRVVATPHIGASTEQAQDAVADEAARVVRAYADGGAVPNVVNVTGRAPASHILVVRHLNRVGVLSHVFSVLKDAEINAEETQNIVFDGGGACIARIAIDRPPEHSVLETIRSGCADVLALNLAALGAQR
jgi:D-3-phosphoglycerate dehydrogenase / 2-oxoglutarate reductase